MKTLSLMDRRRRGAELLSLVLEEAITANYALAQWPTLPAGELPDESLDVAYQALWHFATGDPSQYEFDPFYLDVQIEVLRTVAALLYRGQPLPQDMLAAYRGKSTSTPRFYQQKKSLWNDIGAALSNRVRRGFQEYREAVGLLADLIGNKQRSGRFLSSRSSLDPTQEPMTALFGLEPPPPLFAEPHRSTQSVQPVSPAWSGRARAADAPAQVAVSAVTLTSVGAPDRVAPVASVMFHPFPASFPPSRTAAKSFPSEIHPVATVTVITEALAAPLPPEIQPTMTPLPVPIATIVVREIRKPVTLASVSPASASPTPARKAAFIPQPVATLSRPLPATLQGWQAGFVRQQPGSVTRSTLAAVQFSALNERNAFVLSRRFPTAVEPAPEVPMGVQSVFSA